MINITEKNFIGIDVSKKTLDIFVIPKNKSYRFSNDKNGFQKLIKLFNAWDVHVVVLEASGGYEIGVLLELQKHDINVWRVEPRRILGFKKSEGIYVKTDASDAKILALFGKEKKQKYKQKKITQEELQLQSFSRRRDDLKEFLKAEKTRIQQAYTCKDMIENTIKFLESQIEILELEIRKLIENNQEWNKKLEIAQSMKGVGFGLATKILVDLQELGEASNREIAALAGVAPYANESGSFKGQSFIRGGRKDLRKVLYMAALSAAFYNPVLSKFYEKLIKLGKKPKVALIAVARILLTILNAMFKKQEMWKNV